MAETESKQERATRGRQIAAEAAAEAIQLDRAGRRPEAEQVAVHAYHEGATAMDLLDAYADARGRPDPAVVWTNVPEGGPL